MITVAAHSDRTGERRWHVAACAAAAAAGLAASSLTGSATLALAALCVGAVGLYSATPPFWSLPTAFLRGAGAAAGIGLVNSVGNLGGFVGPYVMGWMQGASGDFRIGLRVLAVSALCSGLLVFDSARSGQVSTTVRTQTTCSRDDLKVVPYVNFATARRTPNAERRTPNAERRTPNAERRTPNAERRTPNVGSIHVQVPGKSGRVADRRRDRGSAAHARLQRVRDGQTAQPVGDVAGIEGVAGADWIDRRTARGSRAHPRSARECADRRRPRTTTSPARARRLRARALRRGRPFQPLARGVPLVARLEVVPRPSIQSLPPEDLGELLDTGEQEGAAFDKWSYQLRVADPNPTNPNGDLDQRSGDRVRDRAVRGPAEWAALRLAP